MPSGKIVTSITILLLLAGCATPKPTPEEMAMTPEAPYVFQGKVGEPMKTAAAAADTTANLQPYAVKVSKIYYQQGTFVNQTGKTITVSAEPGKLKAGNDYVIYAEPYMFGKTIAARLISANDPSGFSQRQVEIMKYTQELRAIQERLRHINVVVSANVVKVSPLEKTQAGESEHSPNLQVAYIKVDRVLRGDVNPGELKIIFSASDDIQWYRAPKLKPGTKGVFLLQRATKESQSLGVPANHLTLFEKIDLQPSNKIDMIETALKP